MTATPHSCSCCSEEDLSASRARTHYGFAVSSRAEVDAVAERGRREGRLSWEPQDFPPPTGYLCAVRDPSGYVIEFSYGQPLGARR